MHAINEIIGGYGTQGLYSKEKPIATYISLGDMEANTIIIDNLTGRIYVTSLASYVTKRNLWGVVRLIPFQGIVVAQQTQISISISNKSSNKLN